MQYTLSTKQSLITRFHNGESVAALCAETGIPRSTLYSWINSGDILASDTETPVTMRDYIRLEQRVQKLEKIIAILKRSTARFLLR